MNKFIVVGVAALLALGNSSCQSGVSSEDIEALKRQNEQILSELKALRESGGAAQARRGGRPPEDFNRVYAIDLAGSPIKGNPDAPVAVVEYSDFQCPFCAMVQPSLEALLKKYPDQVKLVYKHFPLSFHRQARPAALAAMAAHEQGKFWEMHDVLFENQKALDEGKFEEYARSAGLDVTRFKQDLDKKRAEYERQVRADMRQGQQVDVRGTPSLYIGGKKVRDRSIEAMSALVEEALKRGEQKS